MGEAIVWGRQGQYKTKIFQLHCNQGCCVWNYQGETDGIFNWNNKHLFSYSLFFDYLFQALSSGTTYTGFVAHYQRMQEFVFGQKGETFFNLDVRWFSTAFLEFACLFGEETLKFCCNHCGKFPKWLAFDGVAIGIPKKWSHITPIISTDAPSFLH